jgi:quercetin dioxygenase-like cupin family protein
MFSAGGDRPAGTLDVFGAISFVLSDGAAVPIVVIEQSVPPGFAVPNHVHDVDDEISYILEGEIIVGGPRGEPKAGAGACVKLPRGVWHGGDHEPRSPIWRAVRKARVEGRTRRPKEQESSRPVESFSGSCGQQRGSWRPRGKTVRGQ